MHTTTKALLAATAASLAAVIAATVATPAGVWLWAAWAVLAAVTAGVVVVDRRA